MKLTDEQIANCARAIRGALKRYKETRDYQDLYQDSWVYFWKSLNKYDPTKGDLTNWAYNSAIWTVRGNQNLYAKRKRRALENAEPRSACFRRFRGIMRRQFQDRDLPEPIDVNQAVRVAIAKLSRAERRVISHRYEQDLSIHEAAEIAGTSSRTVDTLLCRARKKLRAALTPLMNT